KRSSDLPGAGDALDSRSETILEETPLGTRPRSTRVGARGARRLQTAASRPRIFRRSRWLGLTLGRNGISTTSARTGTPGVPAKGSGRCTQYSVPSGDASTGTCAMAIFASSSGEYHGEVTYPTGSPSAVAETSQKSGA